MGTRPIHGFKWDLMFLMCVYFTVTKLVVIILHYGSPASLLLLLRASRMAT